MTIPGIPRPLRPVALALAFFALAPAAVLANPAFWQQEWPRTDFATTSVDLDEILSGGPPKDGIPAIDDPRFVPVAEMAELTPQEPVIGLTVNDESRAYPLRVLTWHEIVNDTVGGTPVAITYCPLCNSAIVFDRRVEGRATTFGTTGKLRNSDLVMYDRETESWWQQFLGEAIVGKRTGTRLKMLPARLESWDKFRQRHPDGQVLVPNDRGLRSYGMNPYVGYDSRSQPYFPVDFEVPDGIDALARVIRVEDRAWTLDSLRAQGRIEQAGLVLTWEAGQASALDSRQIAAGRDVGNVTVQRRGAQGLEDVPYDVTFAFVFAAFHPEGTLHR